MSNGQEAKDLPNFAGILRPGDSGALDEGRLGSLGSRQQSLPPGRGQAERGSGRRGGDHGQAWRRAQASCGFEWAIQGTRRTTPRSRRRRRSEEGRAKSSEPQATKEREEDRRSGASQGRARIREGAGAPRARTRKGGGGSTKTARTTAEACR